MNDLNLRDCDSMDCNSVGYTYSHNTLNHSSLIDHVFINTDLISSLTNYEVVLKAINLSDHLPIQFCLLIRGLPKQCNYALPKHTAHEFR